MVLYELLLSPSHRICGCPGVAWCVLNPFDPDDALEPHRPGKQRHRRRSRRHRLHIDGARHAHVLPAQSGQFGLVHACVACGACVSGVRMCVHACVVYVTVLCISLHVCVRAHVCGSHACSRSTHGWLMRSNLVYAVHTVEARAWGPYMACNIDPDYPNKPFVCREARVPIHVKDVSSCNPDQCDRTATHAGWYPMSQMASSYHPPHKPLSAECEAAAQKLCNSSGVPLTHGVCYQCIHDNAHSWSRYDCSTSSLKSAFCPAYIKPSAACEKLADALCGPDRASNKSCTECVSNHSAQLFAAGCPQDAKPWHNFPYQLCERPPPVPKANIKLMAKVAGGLWASTPTSHECVGLVVHAACQRDSIDH